MATCVRCGESVPRFEVLRGICDTCRSVKVREDYLNTVLTCFSCHKRKPRRFMEGRSCFACYAKRNAVKAKEYRQKVIVCELCGRVCNIVLDVYPAISGGLACCNFCSLCVNIEPLEVKKHLGVLG